MPYNIPVFSKQVSIIVDIDSAHLRLAFSAYLYLIFILCGIIGGRCCSDQVKLRLLNKHTVPLSSMTGWLSNWTLLRTTWYLRALPGGWFSLVSLFLLVLTPANNFAVTALIQSRLVHDSCTFGTGMVISLHPQNLKMIPPANGQPYFVARQAQLTSTSNSGLQGVYAKVNRATNFSAELSDVLGGWTCSTSLARLAYPYDYSADAIVNDLQVRGLLYGEGPANCSSSYGLQGYSHLIVWDSSVSDDISSGFDIRAAIDVTGNGTDPKEMQMFSCSVGSSALDGILSTIPSHSMLINYCGNLQAQLFNGRFTPAGNDTATVLEQVLNAAIMVSGGNNFLLNTTAADERQGCLVQRAAVNITVVVLTAISTFVLLGMFAYVFVLEISIHKARSKVDAVLAECISTNTPEDILSWILQAMVEASNKGEGIELGTNPESAKSLKYRMYGVSTEHNRPHIIMSSVEELGKTNELVQTSPSNIPPLSNSSPPSPLAPPSNSPPMASTSLQHFSSTDASED